MPAMDYRRKMGNTGQLHMSQFERTGGAVKGPSDDNQTYPSVRFLDDVECGHES